jgi:hypothetical protein
LTPIYSTIDVVQSFIFLRRSIENCKNIFNYCYKNFSFALLNEWNVTKASGNGGILSLGSAQGCVSRQFKISENMAQWHGTALDFNAEG